MSSAITDGCCGYQRPGPRIIRLPAHDATLPISAASVLLSMRTMLDGARAAGLRLDVGFRFGAEADRGRLEGGTIDFARGAVEGAGLVLTGAPAALAAAHSGGVPFAALADALAVEGMRRWPRASPPCSRCPPGPADPGRRDRRADDPGRSTMFPSRR